MTPDELLDAVALVALRLGHDSDAHAQLHRIIKHYQDAVEEARSTVSAWKELAAFTATARDAALEDAAKYLDSRRAGPMAAAIRALKGRA